jgi:hypothetical protein
MLNLCFSKKSYEPMCREVWILQGNEFICGTVSIELMVTAYDHSMYFFPLETTEGCITIIDSLSRQSPVLNYCLRGGQRRPKFNFKLFDF